MYLKYESCAIPFKQIHISFFCVTSSFVIFIVRDYIERAIMIINVHVCVCVCIHKKTQTGSQQQQQKKSAICKRKSLCMCVYVYKKEEKHVIQFNHYHVCYPLNAILDSFKGRSVRVKMMYLWLMDKNCSYTYIRVKLKTMKMKKKKENVKNDERRQPVKLVHEMTIFFV